MFTLGDKLRVLNADVELVVRAGDTTARASAGSYSIGEPITIAGDILVVDTLHVEGFGSFPVSSLIDIKLHRAVTPVNESKDYAVVVPAGLTVGDAIQVRVFAKTTRYQAELKNNFIGAVRPITFMTAPLTSLSPTDIRDAISAAWIDRGFKFNNEAPVIEVINGAAGTDLQINSAPTYESVSISRVEISRANSGIGTQVPVSLATSVVNAVGTEGLGTGKFLEESVKMATGLNTNPFGADQATTNVDIRGEYTENTFVMNTSFDENLSTLAADHGPLNANHRFTLWLNEATCLATDGAIEKMAAVAIAVAGNVPNVTITALANPTPAQERTEAMIIESGSSVNAIVDFSA